MQHIIRVELREIAKCKHKDMFRKGSSHLLYVSALTSEGFSLSLLKTPQRIQPLHKSWAQNQGTKQSPLHKREGTKPKHKAKEWL